GRKGAGWAPGGAGAGGGAERTATGRRPTRRVAPPISHRAPTTPNANRIHAPRTSHEHQFGFNNIKAKRSARLRSRIRSAVVRARKVRLSAGAATLRRLPHPADPASAPTSRVPAAIDFVHKYAETFQPHGRTWWGTSYTGRLRA